MKYGHIPLALLFLVSACSDGLPPEFPVQDFVLKDVYGGKEGIYSDYKDRPLLLYFFASW